MGPSLPKPFPDASTFGLQLRGRRLLVSLPGTLLLVVLKGKDMESAEEMRLEKEAGNGETRSAGSEEGARREEAGGDPSFGDMHDATRVRSAGCIVKRDRLLRELETRGREAGISVVCAPDGFGKTALLLQYAAVVQGDPSRGMARVVDASSMDAAALGRTLQGCAEEMEPAMQPLIAIDALPKLAEDVADQFATLLRALRGRGFQIVIACRPDNREFASKLGEPLKIGAQELAVHPQEYAEWVRAFSISNALDVYELTQGVPALVVQLQTVAGMPGGREELGRAAADLYRSVLDALRRARDPLYRLASFFILLGHGSMTDFERSNMRIRSELLERVQQDYPIFGFDDRDRTFACVGVETAAMAGLRKEIASRSASFAPKAARMLMRSNRVDETVALAGELLDTAGALEVIEQFPAQFALSGNALFVHTTVSRMSGEELARAPVSLVLAVYLSALAMGEYRLARAMCSALQRRAYVIEPNIDQKTWTVARAFGGLWKGCSGTELPTLSEPYEKAKGVEGAALLQTHARLYEELVAGRGSEPPLAMPQDDDKVPANRIDIPELLISCDKLLEEALHGDQVNPIAVDQRLQGIASELAARHLTPIAARVRMVAATCRIMAGLPVVDERAFVDAGTVAVRESNFPTQLFCLLGEGWQALSVNQLVNARFRAQQVLKLSDASQEFLRAWATLLERTSYVLSTSKVTVCEEAELLDLSQQEVASAEAWAVAIHLAAAHFDAELAAWYSLHKDVLLDERFCPMARLAMNAVGERADSIRRLLPRRLASRYLLGDEPAPSRGGLFEVRGRFSADSVGQIEINLFGGFHVERNGHTLTDELWRRRKTSVLAARLALSPGSFVGRRTLTEELWPSTAYGRARENLYVTASTLRSALGQQSGGPQYLLTQGDGLALNSEFVSSDTERFDLLAREILFRRAGNSGRQIIESCLKMEQIYAGDLYVPDTGDTAYFLRMRRMYLSKFVDCMIKGVEAAMDEDDLHSASWMVEAALRHAPAREDVVRYAMRVYDLAGRKREVVELYNSHLYYLEHELHAAPDSETRRTYEEIVERSKLAVMM